MSIRDVTPPSAANKRGPGRGTVIAVTSALLALLIPMFVLINGAVGILSGINYAGDGVQMTDEEIEQFRQQQADPSLQNSTEQEIADADAQLHAFIEANSTPINPDEHDIINILLIGCDSEDYKGYIRSDSMIILSIDKKNSEIKLSSLMRDMRIKIPNHGYDKLNAAFAYDTSGKLLLDTIEDNFLISIDKFVCVNYTAFVYVVDLLGGVVVDVEENEVNAINKSIYSSEWKLEGGGSQNLYGQQLLAYCRMRKVGNDTGRTARQRQALTAIIDKMKTAELSQIVEIINLMCPYILTNMEVGELLSLALDASELSGYTVSQFRVPLDGTWSDLVQDNIWYIKFDLEKNTAALNEFIYGGVSDTDLPPEDLEEVEYELF